MIESHTLFSVNTHDCIPYDNGDSSVRTVTTQASEANRIANGKYVRTSYISLSDEYTTLFCRVVNCPDTHPFLLISRHFPHSDTLRRSELSETLIYHISPIYMDFICFVPEWAWECESRLSGLQQLRSNHKLRHCRIFLLCLRLEYFHSDAMCLRHAIHFATGLLWYGP